MQILRNHKGSILAVAYALVVVLLVMSASFGSIAFQEMRLSQRFRDAALAYWVTEAGLNEYMANPNIFGASNQVSVSIGSGTVLLTKDDSAPLKRVVTSAGTVRGISRTIQTEFATSQSATIFQNTLSSGGSILDFKLKDPATSWTDGSFHLNVNGKTRISGTVVSPTGGAFFQDKQDNVNPSQTILSFPDSNNNGTADEFADFVAFNNSNTATYPPGKVLVFDNNGTLEIDPRTIANAVEVIYVRGENPGTGNVDIKFNTNAWPPNRNLTIISTGRVTYRKYLSSWSSTQQLNVIAWGKDEQILFNDGSLQTVTIGYTEECRDAVANDARYNPHLGNWESMHTTRGIIYTHGSVKFFDASLYGYSGNEYYYHKGLIVSKQDYFSGDWAADRFLLYDATVLDNQGLPPKAFYGLIQGSGGGAVVGSSGSYSSRPQSWKEL